MGPVVHVWDPTTGRKAVDLPHAERIEWVAFGPDPDLVATGSRDPLVRVWDLRRGILAAPPLHHPLGVNSPEFSPHGDRIFTGGGEGTIQSWDWRRGRLLSGSRVGEDFVLDFALTPDRRWIVTTGRNKTDISDARTGTPIAPTLSGRPAINLRVQIPPDGRRAIIGGFSGEVIGYDLAALLAPAEGGAEDLIRDAELVSCLRVHENGKLVPLGPAERLQRWNSRRADLGGSTR